MEPERIRELAAREADLIAAIERVFTGLVLGVEQRIDAIAVGDTASRDEAETGLSQVLGAMLALIEERIRVRREMEALGLRTAPVAQQ